MLNQGFYSLARTSRRRYFWVVWQAIDTLHQATDPDAFGSATSREAAMEHIHHSLGEVEAIDIGHAFAQHWQMLLSRK